MFRYQLPIRLGIPLHMVQSSSHRCDLYCTYACRVTSEYVLFSCCLVVHMASLAVDDRRCSTAFPGRKAVHSVGGIITRTGLSSATSATLRSTCFVSSRSWTRCEEACPQRVINCSVRAILVVLYLRHVRHESAWVLTWNDCRRMYSLVSV